MLTFSEFLAKRRAAFGMSMTELAARLSVTPQYISLLEAGRCNPSRKLQERCAKFFGEDVEYIRFLSQAMSRAQKEALLRSPSALPFLSRQTREFSIAGDGSVDAVQPDAEDRFVRQLFGCVERGESSAESKAFYERLIAEIAASDDNGAPRFSAKARAWAEFYGALLSTDGANLAPVASRFESLIARIEADTSESYPDDLRLEASRRLATARMQSGRYAEAGASYERVAAYARRTEDAESAFDAYQRSIEACRRVGQLDTILEMLSDAVAAEDIPAAVKARLYVTKAQLLYDLGDSDAAVEPVLQAVRIWRLRSLDIPDKTAQLLATQILGLHLYVERGEHAEARQWLGRIRSTLARVTEAEVPNRLKARYAAESDLESAALMVGQERWNHARKNIEEVSRQVDEGVVAFVDDDDEALTRLRLAIMRGDAARGQERISDAIASAKQAVESDHLADPVRDKGRRSHLINEASRVLRVCGETEAAEAARAVLLDELDPSRQPSAALRSLCETDAIRRLRQRIAASE